MTEAWHAIIDQAYPTPAVSAVVEFSYNPGIAASWFGKWVDIPPYSNVVGLWWRAVPVNWPAGVW